jgi:hypothetical protein
MPVDPDLPRKILVVHGVQTGTSEDQDQHLIVDEAIRDRLNGLPLDFETDIYRYEDLNDEAQRKFRDLVRLLVTAMGAKIPLAATDAAIDLIGDVVVNLADGSTAEAIRTGLETRILDLYEKGNPCYVLAHSLGSVYAFDVVNRLISTNGLFERDRRRTWPVQGLVTIGSPLGLSMFERHRVRKLGPGRKLLRWYNYWDRTDPIVSGSFYGRPQQGYRIVERFTNNGPDAGWLIQDRVVDIGRAWLMAHVGYWRHPALADDLITFISS